MVITEINKLCDYFGRGQCIWIYNWFYYRNTCNFYCIPYSKEKKVKNPVCVNLSPNFVDKYNHVLILTKNIEKTENRIRTLNSQIFGNMTIVRSPQKSGHLIMRDLGAQKIMNGDNLAKVIFVYTRKAKELYNFLKINYYYFYIEAMGNYVDPIQCFFNCKRRIDANFESRGLFRINCHPEGGHAAEDEITFVTSNVDNDNFPAYKITAFDIETARIDSPEGSVFPSGETLYDRVCSITLQTVTVRNVCTPSVYENIQTTVLIYIEPYIKVPLIEECTERTAILYYHTEKELLQSFLNYLMVPDAIFITGWNIIHFDYKYLFKRLIYYDIVPEYLTKYLYQYCSLLNNNVCDIAPPWKLTIDTMLSRIKFFPRTLPINPPSNSLDITAKILLNDDDAGKLKIDIKRINYIYANMIMHKQEEKAEIISYLKQLVIYNIKDVELVTKLNAILQVVQILLPLSQLADLNPGDCIHYNASKIGITFMRNKFESIIIAPIDYNLYYSIKSKNISNVGLLEEVKDEDEREEREEEEDIEIKGKKGTYKGATVFEPVKGVHLNTNECGNEVLLGSVDFASLYPNVMLSYGIIRGYVTRLKLSMYQKRKMLYDSFFTPLFTPEDSKHVYLSCKDKTIINNCPISYLCKKLIDQRKLNKKKVPTLANALKVVVNSIYGLFGVKNTPLYCKTVAIMITSYGRDHLMRAKKYFENNFYNLSVLYGDTDSLFIKCINPQYTIYEMTQQYNRHLMQYDHLENIQLSVDGIYEGIIFIRKKLYMARLINENKKYSYKLSGFPQRLQPHIFNLMIQSLYTILDLVIQHKNEEGRRKALCDFYQNLFNNYIEKNPTECYTMSIKVNPLKSYKNSCSRNYYIGTLYEKYHGITITDMTYVSVCEVIPLVKNMCKKKSLLLCLAEAFDPALNSLNKAATISETFCKTLDPIICTILNPNENVTTLKQLSEDYVTKLQNQTLLKYINCNYHIYDFSNCKYQGGLLKISIKNAWETLYKFNESNGAKNRKISWLINEEEEKEEEQEEKEEEEQEKEEEQEPPLKKRKIMKKKKYIPFHKVVT